MNFLNHDVRHLSAGLRAGALLTFFEMAIARISQLRSPNYFLPQDLLNKLPWGQDGYMSQLSDT